MPKSTPKIGFFGFWTKFSPLMCQFFGFKRCTIILFTILRKPHIREKSGSRVIYKMLSANQIVGKLRHKVKFFKSLLTYISKTIWDTRFIIGMQLDINKSYILVMSVSLVLVRFSCNTQKCSRPIRLQGNYLISEIYFKGKFPQNLNII